MNPQPAPEESQVFLSYAREDRVHAEAIAAALHRHGWSVWWDPKIRLGTSYQSTIEAALDAALCVVVLWSIHSRASQWVKEEAQSGVDRGILVPVLLEDVQAPLGFRSLQAAELSGWNGNEGHPEFQKLVEHIEALVGPGTPPERRPGAPRPVAAPTRHDTVAEPRPSTPRHVFLPTLQGTSAARRPETPRHGTLLTRAVTSAERQIGALAVTARVIAVVAFFALLVYLASGSIIWMIIVGLTAGATSKAIGPWRDPGGIIIPILLGIAGSLVGGFLFGGADNRFGLIGSIVGALILVFLYRLIIGRRSTT